MLSISKGEPWAFWPNSVCENFSELSGDKYISGEYNFEIRFKFSVEEDVDQRLTVVSTLPNYMSYDLYNTWVNGIVVNTKDGTTGKQLEGLVKQGQVHELIWKHTKGKYLEVILDSEVLHIVENFADSNETQIIFGAGNVPAHQGNHNYCALNLYEFVFIVDDQVIAKHDFETFIENKAVDLTGNCNFIHKLQPCLEK